MHETNLINDDDDDGLTKILLVKRTPRFFVEVIKNINDKQRQSVKDIGFGHILIYNVDYLPSILAYSLLKIFNSFSCSIKLADEKTISLTEDDVQLS